MKYRPPSAITVVATAVAASAIAALVIRMKKRKITKENERPGAAGSSKGEARQEREARLSAKFKPADGITFFFFPRSPCARRVWLTLLEKGIKFTPVMVKEGGGGVVPLGCSSTLSRIFCLTSLFADVQLCGAAFSPYPNILYV